MPIASGDEIPSTGSGQAFAALRMTDKLDPMTTPPISVKGVLLHQNRVLLLLNERGEWDLPGGRPDPGEDYRAALKREVQEEAGLAVEVGAALSDYLFEVVPGGFVHIMPFVCRLMGGSDVVLSHEHHSARWFLLGELGDSIAGHSLPSGYFQTIRRALV
jgi:8-oxo-dGTP diphosphatase